MRDVFTLCVVVLSLAMVVPVGAGETHSLDYDAAVGVHLMGEGLAVAWQEHGLGAEPVESSEDHTTVAVEVADGLWGDGAALTTCAHNGDADALCDDWIHDCGGRVHDRPDHASNRVQVFIYTLLVTEGLDLCGATHGTVTVTFGASG